MLEAQPDLEITSLELRFEGLPNIWGLEIGSSRLSALDAI